MNRLAFVPVLAVMGLAVATPAGAQVPSRPDWAYANEARQPYNEARRLAYDNGYREGVTEGERDARRRDAFNYQDERTWQRADKGYHRSFGDRERYEQSFRVGYSAGYSDGYRRYGGNPGYGSNGNRGGYYPNDRGRYPGYGGYGNPGSGYPNGGYGYPGDYRSNYSPAYANGVSDGYEKGREDARDRDAYDVLRHKWYREGDRNYRSSYGARQQYENVYRQGFREGYDRGYREASYGR
jgi:flagellar biosynthesis/type III secretory pathway protein FliH